MKDAEKMSERELRAELRETRGLLAASRCPELRCLLGRVTGPQMAGGLWEQWECQWCADRSALLGDN